jgi:hypothetical protein
LLLVKGTTDVLVIEPRSKEDVQADLKVDADKASSSVSGVVPEYELVLQVKSCSTGHRPAI